MLTRIHTQHHSTTRSRKPGVVLWCYVWIKSRIHESNHEATNLSYAQIFKLVWSVKIPLEKSHWNGCVKLTDIRLTRIARWHACRLSRASQMSPCHELTEEWGPEVMGVASLPQASSPVGSRWHTLHAYISMHAILPQAKFWPSSIFVTCVCLCVRIGLSVSLLVYQSWACPHDNSWPIQARSAQFGKNMRNTLVKIPIVLGVDWPRPLRSNLT